MALYARSRKACSNLLARLQKCQALVPCFSTSQAQLNNTFMYTSTKALFRHQLHPSRAQLMSQLQVNLQTCQPASYKRGCLQRFTTQLHHGSGLSTKCSYWQEPSTSATCMSIFNYLLHLLHLCAPAAVTPLLIARGMLHLTYGISIVRRHTSKRHKPTGWRISLGVPYTLKYHALHPGCPPTTWVLVFEPAALVRTWCWGVRTCLSFSEPVS